MIESEFDALKREAKSENGLTESILVRASALYARTGRPAPLELIEEYTLLETLSEETNKEVALNIQFGNNAILRRRAELDALVTTGNSVYSRFIPHRWAKTEEGHFIVPCRGSDDTTYMRELHKDLLTSKSQIAHLDDAYKAKPNAFIIQPAKTTMDAMVAVHYALLDKNLPPDQRAIVEEVKEHLTKNRSRWPHTATRGRYRVQGVDQLVNFPTTEIHPTLDDVKHPLVVASTIDVPGGLVGPDNLFTVIPDSEAMAQALFERNATEVEQAGETVTGHKTRLYRINDAIESDTERPVRFGGSGVGGVFVVDVYVYVDLGDPAFGWREHSEP